MADGGLYGPYSVLSESGTVDDMWVWAVDPDYEAGDASKDDQKDKYKGHLQVRLQQLVNNFFDARRFHEDDYSMDAYCVGTASKECT